MQTNIDKKILETTEGQEAESILRSCVHCGFCNAACPTYQLLGDELDGPRGRIYQIKQMLEGGAPGKETLKHLDRCLTCRSCESTCPSGVQYARLLEIGREHIHTHKTRPPLKQLYREVIRATLANKRLFSTFIKLAQPVSQWLPGSIRHNFLSIKQTRQWPTSPRTRRVILLDGCVQPSLAPDINASCANILDKLGIQAIRIEKDGCCGAINQHMDAPGAALDNMRHNIDTWWPYISTGAEAIISTASACGVMLKDYAYMLRNDPAYAEKARRVSEMSRDVSEVISICELDAFIHDNDKQIAWHPPCTLQHGQKITGIVEDILARCGYQLCKVPDQHLCCGSAGTYSILEKDLSQKLLSNKLRNLQSDNPDMIVTANIGCLLHIRSKSKVPVRHWLELLDEQLSGDQD